MEKAYRVTAHQSDEAESAIVFNEYKILRETEKQFVIEFHRYSPKGSMYDTHERRVSKQAKNPFCFIDKKAALNNFYYRQKRHIKLMSWKIEIITKIRKAVKIMLDNDNIVETKVSQYED